ncbi:uncharacterized protein LOC119186202 [Rhipicephalus microplus]|uniref:uncharacterized protein LOC119186202 n=1 Tax=Rhipicephalus microplus TaxID=6941 RepID=UPI0023764EF5
MTEVRDELTGEPADQNISVYINSKMEAFCTDLIFPFGIPANGIISVFVGEFSALYLREGHEWTESADNVSKQKLVVLCRPYQGKPTCVPVPHVLPNEGESDLEESQGDTVLSQDIMEAVCKERKSTSDRMVISGAHLKLPSTELGLSNIEPDENDRSSAVDLEEFTVGSPVPSVDDADVSGSPVDPELPHIIDRSAPAFNLFSSSEESEDESPCVKKRRNFLRRAAAVPSSAKSSIDEPVSGDDVDEFLCGICKRSFRMRKSCQFHVWSHLNPADSSKRFKCPACIKAFSTSWAQKYHYKKKHVGARHMCSQCDATFESDVALSLHHRRTHTSCAKIHTCEYCLHMFQRQYAYSIHVSKTHGDGTFEMLSRTPGLELRCSHCSSFTTSSDVVLTRHLQSTHPEAKTFRCTMCSLLFQEEKDREEHEWAWHTLKQDHCGNQLVYVCHFCDRRITTLPSFSFHLRRHLGSHEKMFLCPTCGKQLGTAATLRIHMTLHEDKPWLQCPHCPRQFRNRVYMRKHILRFHDARLCCTCSHCGKRFVSSKQLHQHLAVMHIDDLSPDEMALVSKLKKYYCELCPFVAYTWTGVSVHMSEHPAAQWLKCSRCSCHYPSEIKLMAHEARSHKTGEIVKCPCPLCPRVFFSKALFDEHTQLHANGNGIKCLQCDMLFATAAKLERHQERHGPTIAQACKDCGRAFASMRSLQMHQRLLHLKCTKRPSPSMQSHGGSHECPHCQKQFRFTSGLQAHVVYRHEYADSSSENKLPCPICGKMCSSQGAMSVHLRIHLNEQPYVCAFCDQRFTNFAAAKAHSARHLTTPNFQCDRCSKQFLQRKKLNEHVHAAHSVQHETELSVGSNSGQPEVIEGEAVVEAYSHSVDTAHNSMPVLHL